MNLNDKYVLNFTSVVEQFQGTEVQGLYPVEIIRKPENPTIEQNNRYRKLYHGAYHEFLADSFDNGFRAYKSSNKRAG